MEELHYPMNNIEESLYRYLTIVKSVKSQEGPITFSAQQYSIFYIFLLKLYQIYKKEGDITYKIIQFLLNTKDIFYSHIFLEITYKIFSKWTTVDEFIIIIEFSKQRIGV